MSTNLEVKVQDEINVEGIFNEITGIVSIYNNNKELVIKAYNAGKKLIEEIKTNGMTAERDGRANSYLLHLKETKEKIKTAREPGTKSFTLITKSFTNLENTIGEIELFLQKNRNTWAEYVASENARIEKENRLKIEKANDRVKQIGLIKTHLNNEFSILLSVKLKSLNEFFKNFTLLLFEEKTVQLNNFSFNFTHEMLSKFPILRNTSAYLTADEFSSCYVESVQSLFDNFQKQYSESLENLRQELIIAIPAKKDELLKIAEYEKEQEILKAEQQRLEQEKLTANAKRQEEIKAQQAEQQRKQFELEQQRILEEQQEMERLRAEQLQAKARVETLRLKNEKTIEIATQGAIAVNMVQQPEEVIDSETKIKEGIEIQILSPAAYVELFTNWFQNEAIGMQPDKLAIKLDFIVTFNEKQVLKDENNKIKSNFIQYKTIYKAVTKK